MFHYTIALDVSFSGQTPTIEQDEEDDMPMYARLVITLAHPVVIQGPGGAMTLPTGSQITGTIVGKEAIPQN